MAKRPVNDNQPTSDNDNDASSAAHLVPANDDSDTENPAANDAGKNDEKTVNEAALASMAASLAYATFNVSSFVADNDEEAEERLRELEETKRKANREAGLARMRENNRRLREAAQARKNHPDQMNLFGKPENDA